MHKLLQSVVTDCIMDPPKPKLSAKVEELKVSLGELKELDAKLSNEFYLAHWLRACKHDVSKTKEAIDKNLKWRKENNVEDLLAQDLSQEIAQYFPYFFDAKGKGGNPVVFAQLGEMDIADICKKFGLERLMSHLMHVLVKMEKIVVDWDNEWQGTVDDVPSERSGGFFGVYDAAGFAFRNAASMQALQFWVEWTKMSINYFPSCNRRSCVINASKLVEIPHRLIKPLVASKGFDVIVFGSSEDDLQKHVYPVMEQQQIEEFQARARTLKNGRSPASS